MARRLYGLDGAHLKGEMNNYGVYLIATTKDYNNHILPFAFSLVPTENYDNWVWFSKVVEEALGELKLFTIVSDRQKGLLSAVNDVFPEAGHRFCLRHNKSNINTKGISLTGKERGLINDMARSDCESDYKVYEKELAKTKLAAAQYLQGVDKNHWVKYKYQEHFKIPNYDETTSNLAEQANSWIGNDYRSAKPLDAFALYFRKLSELVSDKSQMVANWITKVPDSELVPLIGGERKKLIVASEQCKGIEFPCVHAIAAAVKEGQALDTLYDAKKLSISHFREMYSAPFRPWPTDVTLEKDSSIHVSPIRSDPPELGKRGLKPGPKPKHKRRKAKGSN